jgi:ubiquinone/menaquinone biosynthesis C-methylase UbiE
MASKVPADLKARLKTSYDIIAPVYNKWATETFGVRLEKLNLLTSHFPTEGNVKVLELGCGAGFPVTQHLASIPNVHVTGNDLSSTQIALAREKLVEYQEKIDFIECDMMSLHFAPATVDAVVALYSIIHLPRDEQVSLVSRIHKWLKPSGHFLVNFTAGAFAAVYNEHWLHEKGWMFWSGWGAEATTKIVQDAGFDLILNEVRQDAGDAAFHWILAKKSE